MLVRTDARSAVAVARREDDSGRRGALASGAREAAPLGRKTAFVPGGSRRVHPDGVLVEAARAGDGRARAQVVGRYGFLVRLCAREFFAPGHEHEDLEQAGYLGLMDAVEKWDAARGASFQSFARLAIRTELLNFVAAANRRKAQVLTTASRLHRPAAGADGLTEDSPALADVLPAPSAPGHDPWATLEAKTTLETLVGKLPALSRQQRRALTLSLNGRSRVQSAAQLGITPKAVDNSLRKARAKLAAAVA